jgi:lysophospholipase L1-like esterase
MRRRILFDILAAVGSFAILTLGIEAYVRFVIDDGMQYDLEMWKYARDVKQLSNDPLIGHEHAPNRRTMLMGVEFNTNSQGLRDREVAYAKPPGRLRLLMLGDSLTVGWGVAAESTFARRIEKMYADRGVDAEVINAGVGNYNTVQEAQYFLTRGFEYKPDIVVLNFFVNDAEPVPAHDAPSIAARVCYACIFIRGRLDTLVRMVLGHHDWASYYLGLYDGGRARGWLDAKHAIRRLADYTRVNGIRLIVASLPELHDIAYYRLQPITELVREAASENGVEFVDILPYLRGHPSSALWVTAPDPHPNALAHQLIAKGLFDALAAPSSPRDEFN